MLLIITMAAVSVAAFLITLARVVGWKCILRNATLVDVTFTFGTFVVFAGTITGALVAVLGGLIMALLLSLLKWGFLSLPGDLAGLRAKAQAYTGRGRSGNRADRCDASEYNSRGQWIYNAAPYI